jgi:hypothetical protein
MLFESLLWHGFRSSAKLEDDHLEAVVQSLSNTVTLAFAIDNANVRRALSLPSETCCDGLFLSVRRVGEKEPEVSLLFLEMKGKHIDHAIDQLESAIRAVQRILRSEEGMTVSSRTRFVAAVVSDRAAPQLVKPDARRRLQKLGVAIELRSGERRGKSADLTDLVWARSAGG